MGNVCLAYLVTVSLFLYGCAVSQIADVPTSADLSQVEGSRVFAKDYDAVWSATVKTISTAGFTIQTQDKSSGNISTDFFVTREAIGIFTTGSRYKLNVIVERKSASATQVTLTPTFQIRVSDKANWSPTQRKRDQVNIEKRLLDWIQSNLR